MSTALADPPVADVAALGFKLNFFKLVVRDLDAMVDFYTTAFGFEVQNRIRLSGLEEVMLVLPGERFNLVLYHHTDGRAVEIGDGHGPLGFITRDLDAALGHVLASGATPDKGPIDLPGMRLAFVHDPEGHELELIQIVRPSAAAEKKP
ncbi:VOC family protein [Sphingomonas turrisvirgatae]|uniref:VOC family protein n=1 Tax=Sphingomonas turrisvirgatae TaxID=1888892 RepID=UPI0009A1ED75|nr:VOC family protein [Sphingomonas turrisvirgatae]